MKKRTYVGAVTRPVSLTSAIRVENPYSEQNTGQYGTSVQSYDSLTGDYFPDRQNYPTLLGLHVLLEDGNAAVANSEVTWTGGNTVSWEVTRNGVTTAVTAQSTGVFTLSGQQLRVRLNQTAEDGNVTVRAKGTFYDSVGRAHSAVAELPLTLSVSTTTNLVLLRDKLDTRGYVGEFFRLNPLTLDTLAKVDNADNWKKRCAVQLCDGTTPLPDAFRISSSVAVMLAGVFDDNLPNPNRYHSGDVVVCGMQLYECVDYYENSFTWDTPENLTDGALYYFGLRVFQVSTSDGTHCTLREILPEDEYLEDSPLGLAYYFWFYRTPDGRLVQCTEDTEWLDAAWSAHGTATKEVVVDLTKVQQVRLVCRAGHIPYGELEDYLDADGLLRPDKLLHGFREVSFDVGVELPDAERIVVSDIAHCRLERPDLASSTVTVVKRALVTAGGTTLNDLTETSPHNAATQSWVEKLYKIEWFLTKPDATEVSIGTGEWLQITPAQLATLYGAALNADAMPAMTVAVEPRYPKLTGNNYVEGYQRGASAITPSQQQGNKGFLKQLDFWLLDTTDNEGETTQGMKLRRNNILRFAGGGWAPAVRISEEMAADAELALFHRNAFGGYAPYCNAGEYSPEGYVESVLRPYFAGTLTGWYAESDGGWPRLYKVDTGNAAAVASLQEGVHNFLHDVNSNNHSDWLLEAHALLPWETTETKYTTGVGFGFGVYLLDHQEGDSGWEWNGIFTDRTEWDGIDFSRYYLPPTAFSPGPSTQITEGGRTVFRNFFYLAHPQGGIGGASAAGILGSTMFNESGRAYPKVDDVNALTNAERARANNHVATDCTPFAEGGWHTLNTLVTSQELLYSRRNPFLATMFGSGISSNDACSSEATWRQNGGFRHKVSGAAGYGYGAWSTKLPVKSATNSTNDASADINNYKGKEQCMESQLAASFAAEFGIAKTTDTLSPNYFVVYGGRYYWMAPDGVESLTDGYMNVRVYRELSDTLTGYDSGGTQTTCEFAAILRMSLMGGMNLSGDIYMYAQGGAEVIGECTVSGSASVGNPVAAWLIPDQAAWLSDTAVTKDSPAKFLIEDCADAIKTGEGTNLANGYYARRLGYSPLKAANGGGLASYECCYGYTANNWNNTVGKRARIALRFRGSAYFAACSPRYWHAFSAASFTYRSNGGSAQALLGT